jgi:hypothetical protein
MTSPPTPLLQAYCLYTSLSSPLNPCQLLYLGRPQDRTGSPILGDLEERFPPCPQRKGGEMQHCEVAEEMCIHRSLQGEGSNLN